MISEERVTYLRSVFEQVQNKTDWKMPISADVPKGVSHDDIHEAIVFFTGSEPFFVEQGKDNWRVLADGYYITIGA